MPDDVQRESYATADVEDGQQLNVDTSRICKPDRVGVRAKRPSQDETKQPACKTEVLLLDMSGVLKRNIYVSTTHDDLAACKVLIASCCEHDRKALRQRYEDLYVQCTQKDAEIHRSYQSFPRTAEIWKKFCKDCTCLMLTRQKLFVITINVLIINQWDEEQMSHIESLHVHGKYELSCIVDIELLQPDVLHYIRVPPHVLRWNNKVSYKGTNAILVYTQAVAKYEDDRAAAIAAYQKHLEQCKKLDSDVMCLDSEYPDEASDWAIFHLSYMWLVALRRVLYVHHKYDPFEAALIDDDVHRSPEARKRCTRLQLMSPTKPTLATPRQTAVTYDEEDSPEAVYTKAYNINACLCIHHSQVVWRQGALVQEDENLTASQQAHMATYVTCADVHSDDQFTFHVAGIVHSQLWSFTATGSLLLKAYEQAQQLYKNSPDPVTNELKALQQYLQQTDPEQLANLDMIGVLDAANKYEQFRANCAVYLMLKQLVLGTPLVVASSTEHGPQISVQTAARLLVSIRDEVRTLGRSSVIGYSKHTTACRLQRFKAAMEHVRTAQLP